MAMHNECLDLNKAGGNKLTNIDQGKIYKRRPPFSKNPFGSLRFASEAPTSTVHMSPPIIQVAVHKTRCSIRVMHSVGPHHVDMLRSVSHMPHVIQN